jgi:hypothetical protein
VSLEPFQTAEKDANFAPAGGQCSALACPTPLIIAVFGWQASLKCEITVATNASAAAESKIMRNLFRHVPSLVPAAALGLLLLTGCNTVSIRTREALGVPTFPPNPNPTAITILTTPPTQPHFRLGDIQAEPSSDSVSAAQITQSLQKAAAKLGAEAVVIAYDQNQVLGAMVTGPWWGPSLQTYTGRVIIGVAIKYQ